ncbi:MULTISPECIES: VOC family protein [Clostridiaceae]|uniref:VOC family protein n=1 Tax=Clostridium facile TaxID=2763035 RepID=A0ABR7IPT1_9CLOT|nr:MULTISPECIES: VOC family protein [Clostridiaceae]MBC5787145.1 VOC family protein [Clostridium facile]
MKFRNPLLVVSNLEQSKSFYSKVLGLHVTVNFGQNVTLTGGICLQTKKSWLEIIEHPEEELYFGGKNTELYFEEDNFDQFIEMLEDLPEIQYVHPVKEHPWGQRVVRFYDPDMNIIEVGENMKIVCQRFLNQGLTIEQVAKRMDVPEQYIKSYCY